MADLIVGDELYTDQEWAAKLRRLEYHRAYMRRWRTKPGVRERERAYYARPEVRERQLAYLRKYRDRP